MWIFTSQGMISIVKHRNEPQLMMVRARQAEVLKTLFPEEKLLITPDADYRYRMEVPQSDVINALQDQLETMQYDNFKNSIGDHDYHTACSQVWSVMYRYQQGVTERQQQQQQEEEPTATSSQAYRPLSEFLKSPAEQARQRRIASSAFPDDFGGCSDNYRK